MPTLASKHYWTGCLALSGSKLRFNFDFDQTSCLGKCSQNIYIRVKAKAVVPCYGQFICVWQPAAKVTRLLAQLTMWQRALLVTMLSNSGSRFYSLYSYLYYIGVRYIEVLRHSVTGENAVEAALSAHQPKLSPLQNSPQHMLLFDEFKVCVVKVFRGGGRQKHVS